MSKPRIAPLRDFPISGDVLFDPHDDEMTEAELVRETHKWTRLTVFAIAGMLTDMQGSVLEKEDVDLLLQVAYIADAYAKLSESRDRKAAA